MKKVIIIVVVLALGALAYLYFETDNDSSLNKTDAEENGGALTGRDPSNATFTFDDGPITLSGGRNEKEVSPDSALVEETVLLDKFAYGDLNADDREDTALFLTRYGGGSGSFLYVAAVVSGPVTYRGSQAIFLGDRISPQDVSINAGVITVSYLDRAEDEPLVAEPTVKKSRQFVYVGGQLQER